MRKQLAEGSKRDYDNCLLFSAYRLLLSAYAYSPPPARS